MVASLLNEYDTNRAELLAAIAGLDEAALDTQGVVGDWSIKNLLAHLTAWEDWAVQALAEIASSGVLPARLKQPYEQGFATWNAAQVAEREELTPDEQLVELERVRAELRQALSQLDDARLAASIAWDSGSITLADFMRTWPEHDREHLPALRQAVAQLRANES